MVEAELLPCPFCDSDLLWVTGHEDREYDGFEVECKKCDALGPNEPTRAKAIAAWNRRPPPSTAGWLPISDRLKKMAALVLKNYQNAMNCPATSPVYKHLWGTYRDAAAMYAHEMAAFIAAPSQEGASEGEGQT